MSHDFFLVKKFKQVIRDYYYYYYLQRQINNYLFEFKDFTTNKI